ncbi:MFS transporter [Ramlibacter sp. Leaf400]|uniref:MFS transporter n=1 Tax=Ramlibacter sp. Leaf400 TaxID=1736365 RepID=UPI0006F6C173|nr:MFS transporter [Ramlibacter sp. Leaf400]KQT09412.1 MFS transporter [Ramlibacter sp. Leaf400]
MPTVPSLPERLDRLPWSRWHWRVVLALGVAWVLDGLEVTIVGSVGSVLQRTDTLGLSTVQVGWAGSLYVGGAVLGALVFGRLADRLGRKRLFLWTLAIYMAATVATAFSGGFASFAACRFVTGIGIGGEYAAINSAIDELIPARVRGRVSLAINGSFWIGAALGALLSLVLLDARVLGPELGWRAGFLLGAVLALAILLVRRNVPESPRWLLSQGRVEEAERIVADIEAAAGVRPLEPAQAAKVDRPRVSSLPTLRQVAGVLIRRYPERSAVVLALMVSQAFFYNAIFFTYSLVLTRFYAVDEARVGLFIVPFAVGNVLGPLLLGPLFDRLGRRRMITATYGFSGVALAATGAAFLVGALDAMTQTLAWSAVFFLASAAASSAYLTVSEVFPLEMRALAISLFYAVGTGIGGFAAPALFGMLVASGSRANVFAGYLFGAVLVLVAAAIAWRHAVDAERKPLEEVAPPLGPWL